MLYYRHACDIIRVCNYSAFSNCDMFNVYTDVLNYVKEEYPMFELLLRQGLFSDCLSEEGLVELPQYQETPSICSHPISQESGICIEIYCLAIENKMSYSNQDTVLH